MGSRISKSAFAEHEKVLEQLGAECIELRQARDLAEPYDALVLPGGESTVMRKLLGELDLFESLRQRIADGMPVFGTCAGLILLAKQVDGGTPCFATMDISVKRNAYGRQLGSFRTAQTFGKLGTLPMTFIRAPYIAAVHGDAQILASADGNIVAAQQNKQLVTAFHPELDESTAIHEYFLQIQ